MFGCGLGVGLGVRALCREIGRARREHAHEAAALRQGHARVARRHERHRVAADRLLLRACRDFGDGRRVMQQHDVFVDLALARERRAGLRLGVGDDEVLAACVPGLAVLVVVLRLGLVELGVLGRGEFDRWRHARLLLGQCGAWIGGVVHRHRNPPSRGAVARDVLEFLSRFQCGHLGQRLRSRLAQKALIGRHDEGRRAERLERLRLRGAAHHDADRLAGLSSPPC